MRIDRRRVALEFTSIVIAVVLAMSLSEMRQNHLNRKLAAESFNNIITEIEENRQELRNDSAKLAKDLQFISKWISDVKEGVEHESFSTNFSFSFLGKSAREVAKSNQSLTFLSNEKNMGIAEVYATQEFYSEQGSKMFDLMEKLIGKMSENSAKEILPEVLSLRFRMNLIFSTVKAYLKESEEFLTKFEIK